MMMMMQTASLTHAGVRQHVPCQFTICVGLLTWGLINYSQDVFIRTKRLPLGFTMYPVGTLLRRDRLLSRAILVVHYRYNTRHP